MTGRGGAAGRQRGNFRCYSFHIEVRAEYTSSRSLPPRPSGRALESPAGSSDNSPSVGCVSEISRPVRFGLVGTGYWACELHAVGVAGHRDAELVGVWGRDPDKAAALAETHGATGYSGSDGYDGYDDMLAVVDAVVFSVPPDVQAPLAVRAAQAGRHLLLEKPVALSHAAASEVADAVAGAGVASVVFFTERFVAEREAWLQERVAAETLGGEAAWLASLRTPDNPFAGSQWRQQRGGLWDVGPHALSVLLPVLGPVTSVAGARGREDLVHLVLTHENGATSTVALSLTMPPDATRAALAFYDERGWHTRPEQAASADAVSHQRRAVGELVENLRAGQTEHRVDVRFGAEVVRVLELAQQVVDAGGQPHASSAPPPPSWGATVVVESPCRTSRTTCPMTCTNPYTKFACGD